jgi:catechol 2,3-dioxygenase
MVNFHQSPTTFIQSISLNVNNRQKMVDFYQWLGMTVLHQTSSATTLGTSKPLVTLIHDRNYEMETKPTQGLYHVAYLLPDRQALGSVLNHLLKAKYPLQGLSDHGVSEAIYLADPEGNGIEMYVDRDPKAWPYDGQSLTMVTEMMKYKEVLALAKPFVNLPKETILGHLHLHVGSLKEATTSYQQIFGFQVMQHYGDSAVFLSSGGYHHHLGINTWLGKDIPKKNPLTTGLIAYEVHGLVKKSFVDLAGINVTFKQ